MEIYLPEEKFVYGVTTKTSIPIKNLISNIISKFLW